MTISTEVRKAGPYYGNDSAGTFPFAFKVFKKADLIVVRRNDIVGVDMVLVLDSDYSVSLNADQNVSPGGNITLLGGPLSSNFSLVISSDLPLLQQTDLTNQGGFYPKVVTDALDRLTIFSQQLAEKLGRAIKLPITAPNGVNTELPFPTPNNVIGWDSLGTALRNVTPQELATVVAYGDTAADLFTGDGVTTTFALSSTPGSVNNMDVSVNGATKRPGEDYTWDLGTNIIFKVAPPAPTIPGDKNILVRHAGALPQQDQALREDLAADTGSTLVGQGSYDTLRGYRGTGARMYLYGKRHIFDGGHGWAYRDDADTTSLDNGGTIWVDALGRRWKREINGAVHSLWFCEGDETTDDTVALGEAKAAALLAKSKELYLDPGTYSYTLFDVTSLPTGFILRGAGVGQSVLKYTGSGTALGIDAFASGSPSSPFINAITLQGFTLWAPSATKLWTMQGVARSYFKQIRLKGASVLNSASIAAEFKGVMLSHFEDVVSSYEFGAVPYRGLVLDEGRRAGVSVGACSNNVFISTYWEGQAIGVQYRDNGADQNVMIGGSPESCSAYGMLVGVNCRYNTQIGVGFENVSATADVLDIGISSDYLNCYSSKAFIIDSGNRSIRVKGGFFERIQINNNTKGQEIEDVVINHWASGAGGFFNNGVGLRFKNIWDADLGNFIYPNKDRVSVSVSSSPFTLLNDEMVPMKIRIQGGTVDVVQVLRGTDSWVEPNPSAAGGGTSTVGVYLVLPGESLRVTYSAAPTVNKIALNGL